METKLAMQSSSSYPINFDLCVLPSIEEKETQFEAFQSILTQLLNANPDSVYSLMLQKHSIPLHLSKKENKENKENKKDGIYYQRPYRGSTHYTVIKNGKVLDPYDFYQPQGTQGFCQLFAFFMFLNQVDDFKLVQVKKKVSVENFVDYAHNTLQCLKQFLEILKTDSKLRKVFQQRFRQFVKNQGEEYGISPKTSPTRFLHDLSILNLLSSLYYIYDNPLKGWKTKQSKDDLWKEIISSSHKIQ